MIDCDEDGDKFDHIEEHVLPKTVSGINWEVSGKDGPNVLADIVLKAGKHSADVACCLAERLDQDKENTTFHLAALNICLANTRSSNERAQKKVVESLEGYNGEFKPIISLMIKKLSHK